MACPSGPGVHSLTACHARVASNRPSSPSARHAAGLSPGLAKMREEVRAGLSTNMEPQGKALRWGRMCVSPVQHPPPPGVGRLYWRRGL